VFTFTFPAGTQIADPDLIKNAVIAQAAYFQTVFGRTITQATTISGSLTAAGCANQGSSAFTGQRTMTICVGNGGWTVHSALNRQKIIMHETFHLLQFEMQWTGSPTQNSGAHWLVEGTAEFMGWRGVANAGAIAYDAAKNCMVAQANAQLPPSATLGGMETAAGFGVPGAYQFSMLASDQLVAGTSFSSLMTYGTALAANTPWATAFQSAWGQSSAAFYAQFPAYRTSLGAGADTCGT
jgi:hypothetical protein